MNGKKVGLITIALGFIAIGTIIILHMMGYVSFNILQYLWPLLIIFFGIEIIWARFLQREGKMRFSGWSVLFIILIALVSLAQYSIPRISGNFFGPDYGSEVSGQVAVNNKIKTVNIDIPSGNITITGTNNQVLSYTGELYAHGSSQSEADKLVQAHFEVQQSGDTLEMTYNNPDSGVGINLDFLQTTPYLDIHIPQSLFTKVHTHNASIHVLQMNANTDVETSNGGITIKSIHGNVTATSSNGSVNLSDITGSADVRSSNAKIELTNILGPVVANTSNGRIEAISDIQGNWDCTTSNGSISFAVPQNTNAKITAITSNASIGGGVNWTFDDSHHGTCNLGNGNNTINLRTSNGKISVDNTHPK